MYFSTKVEKKLPGDLSDHYELILGSTQMQLLGEQRFISVYPRPQNRSYRGCYWQIGHMLLSARVHVSLQKGKPLEGERELVRH